MSAVLGTVRKMNLNKGNGEWRGEPAFGEGILFRHFSLSRTWAQGIWRSKPLSYPGKAFPEQLQGNQHRRFLWAEWGLGLKGWGQRGPGSSKRPCRASSIGSGWDQGPVVFGGLKGLQLTIFPRRESSTGRHEWSLEPICEVKPSFNSRDRRQWLGEDLVRKGLREIRISIYFGSKYTARLCWWPAQGNDRRVWVAPGFGCWLLLVETQRTDRCEAWIDGGVDQTPTCVQFQRPR